MSANWKRRVAGKRAKAEGDAFESALDWTAKRAGFETVALPTGCKVLGGGRTQLVKTPFDRVYAKYPQSLFVDAKSTAETNFQYSMIKTHQVDELLKLERAGFRAGYIVHFRKTGEVAFLSAGILNALRPGESLSAAQGVSLGTFQAMDLARLL